MSLSSLVNDLAARIAAEIKSVWSAVGGKADDSAVVHNTGTETIGGAKTFSVAPQVPVGALLANPVRRDDARLTDARTPLAHASSHTPGGSDPLTGYVPATRSVTAGTGLTGGGTLAADRSLAVAYGTTAGTAAQGNDSRLSNARTPTAHASTHASGGTDPVTPAAIGAAASSHTHSAVDVTGGPVASLYQSTAQSIPNNAWTAILLQSETLDTDNGHSTSTNTSRWTCPSGWAGIYDVGGVVYYTGNTAGVRLAAIFKNGLIVPGTLTRVRASSDGGGDGVVAPRMPVQLAVGDYVELMALQTVGAALNTFAGATYYFSGLSVVWRRPT